MERKLSNKIIQPRQNQIFRPARSTSCKRIFHSQNPSRSASVQRFVVPQVPQVVSQQNIKLNPPQTNRNRFSKQQIDNLLKIKPIYNVRNSPDKQFSTPLLKTPQLINKELYLKTEPNKENITGVTQSSWNSLQQIEQRKLQFNILVNEVNNLSQVADQRSNRANQWQSQNTAQDQKILQILNGQDQFIVLLAQRDQQILQLQKTIKQQQEELNLQKQSKKDIQPSQQEELLKTYLSQQIDINADQKIQILNTQQNLSEFKNKIETGIQERCNMQEMIYTLYNEQQVQQNQYKEFLAFHQSTVEKLNKDIGTWKNKYSMIQDVLKKYSTIETLEEIKEDE